MKNVFNLTVLATFLICSAAPVFGQGTAFTYQGKLNVSGSPGNGSYDVQFALYPTSASVVALAGSVTNAAVAVSNGLFTTVVDFGNAFTGASNWLEMAVSTNGANVFTTLSPRQQLTATPYAVHAANATTAATAVSASSVAAANITGIIPAAQLPANVVTNGATNVNFSGTFTGNGAGVTNLSLYSLGANKDIAWGGFAQGSAPAVGTSPATVIAADVNGDGWIDLICANSGTNTLSVLTNNRKGGFVLSSTPTVGLQPVALVSADVNGDGKVDLISANLGSSTLSVLTNNGSGGFALQSSPATGSPSYSVAAGDLNRDGKIDLISANFNSDTLSLFLNTGSGGFSVYATPGVGDGPRSVIAADFNGDGAADLACANFNNHSVTVLLNAGNGSFYPPATLSTGINPISITAADLNGDGMLDLAVANYVEGGSSVSVFANAGGGIFTNFATLAVGLFPASIVAADVDGDGANDLILATVAIAGNGANSISILKNNGGGNFTLLPPLPVGSRPENITSADVNGDGKPDLIHVVSGNNTLSVLVNTPTYTGKFSSPQWNFSEVFAGVRGPLPRTNTFVSNGGKLLFSTSGTGFTTSSGRIIGMNVILNGTTITTNNFIYANSASFHMSFCPLQVMVANIPAGTNTLILTPFFNTSTDSGDVYNVSVTELPW